MVSALVICYDYLPQVHSLAIVINEKKQKVQKKNQNRMPECEVCKLQKKTFS